MAAQYRVGDRVRLKELIDPDDHNAERVPEETGTILEVLPGRHYVIEVDKKLDRSDDRLRDAVPEDQILRKVRS